jgi:branched-chain amino acid transport system ATP-binding protein
MSDAILSVRNLESYYGPITAIRGVSFDVKPGQIVTILGANGAGKTTVLKSVCGAMEPQKGTVTFGGRSITGREPDWVARNGMAHVP